MTEYLFEECTYYYPNDDVIQTVRCPECKEHGENIETRGDCKNLIKKENGEIIQCQCYSKEHK